MTCLAIRRSFGISGTSAPAILLGSADDLVDAFRRHTPSSSDSYTFEEFKGFVAAVKETGCDTPGLEYYGDLLETYVQRVPDLGWERCARQVWPLLAEAKKWVEDQKIPIEHLGVRPVFQAVQGDGLGAYEIRAFICYHGPQGCDCGQH